MSDRENSGDTAETTDAVTPKANYTLEIEVDRGIESPFIKLDGCTAHKLQNGFLVVVTNGKEFSFQAKNILSIRVT